MHLILFFHCLFTSVVWSKYMHPLRRIGGHLSFWSFASCILIIHPIYPPYKLLRALIWFSCKRRARLDRRVPLVPRFLLKYCHNCFIFLLFIHLVMVLFFLMNCWSFLWGRVLCWQQFGVYGVPLDSAAELGPGCKWWWLSTLHWAAISSFV